MTFSICVNEDVDTLKTIGEILLGDHRESFPLITTRWSCENYQSQWFDALMALVDEMVSACVLIVDIQNPSQSFGVSYWALFRERNLVHFQERFSRDLSNQLMEPPGKAALYIPPRR